MIRTLEKYDVSARFWGKIFAINFLLGVVTGIPMEFQFGTNWSEFSRRTGGVIGMPLAMEGIFSFFLESAFLGLFLFGEKRLSRRLHWLSAFLVFLGSWISGFFIIVTNAWMQHPVGYQLLSNGVFEVTSFTQTPAESLGMAGVRAQHVRCRRHGVFCHGRRRSALYAPTREGPYGRIFLKLGVIAGIISCTLQVFPTGDLHGKYMAKHQPTAIAAMEGLFHTEKGAGMVADGAARLSSRKPSTIRFVVNKVLSFLIYGTTCRRGRGARSLSRDQWPSTLAAVVLQLPHHGRPRDMVWSADGHQPRSACGEVSSIRALDSLGLLLSWPLPYIATTAGWMTAEIGRQPWLVYRPHPHFSRASCHVGASNSLFTLLGFLGMYTLLSLLWIILVYNHIQSGQPCTARPDILNLSPRKEPTSYGHSLVLDRRAHAHGLCCPRWFRSRRRHRSISSSRAPSRERAQALRIHRPGLGRQRSLAARCRRHALLRLSAALRLGLQRLLSSADDRALADHSARRQHRASRPLSAPLWRSFFEGLFSFSSALLAIFFGAALGTSSAAFR